MTRIGVTSIKEWPRFPTNKVAKSTQRKSTTFSYGASATAATARTARRMRVWKFARSGEAAAAMVAGSVDRAWHHRWGRGVCHDDAIRKLAGMPRAFCRPDGPVAVGAADIMMVHRGTADTVAPCRQAGHAFRHGITTSLEKTSSRISRYPSIRISGTTRREVGMIDRRQPGHAERRSAALAARACIGATRFVTGLQMGVECRSPGRTARISALSPSSQQEPTRGWFGSR